MAEEIVLWVNPVAESNIILSPVPTKFPLPIRWTGEGAEETERSRSQLKEWNLRTDPTEEIFKLKELRSLRFVLFKLWYRPDQFYSNKLTNHPIHRADFSGLSKVQVSMLNLRGHFKDDVSLINDVDSMDKSTELGDDENELPLGTKAFCNVMKELGWKIEQAFYDNHHKWPVKEVGEDGEEGKCVDKRICLFLRNTLRRGTLS
jgi:hypothetical protein